MLAHRLRDRHEDHAGLFQLRLEGGRDRNGIEHRIDRDARSPSGRSTPASNLLLAQRNAELLVGRAGSPDRPRRATSGRPSSSARRSNRCPGNRSSGMRPAPRSARAWSASGDRRRAASRASIRGSFFLAEMKRTMSSDRPFGALSDSITSLESILILVDVDMANLFDGFLDGRHFSLPSRFQGPQRMCRLSAVLALRRLPSAKPLKRR